MPDNAWFDTIKTSLTKDTATWLVGFLIAILTLFSKRITESIKFALNRADHRTKQHEELATEVSQSIFAAELITEFIENDWTTKPTMTELLKMYNDSIITLRKKEFVYRAWVQKYWGKNESGQFESFIDSVRKFDSAIHSLNDEFEEVNIKKSKPKIDRKRADEALKLMKPAMKSMDEQGRLFLAALAGG